MMDWGTGLENSVLRYPLPGSLRALLIIRFSSVLLFQKQSLHPPTSLRMDPQAKAFAQMLLDIELPVPEKLALSHDLA